MNIYKDSGVEWIGEIPGHWSVTKLKNQCQIIPSNVDKKTQDDEIEVSLCNYVDVYHNDFINCSLEFMIATANEHELKKFQLIKEDVLITKDSEDPYDIAVPALVVETQPKLLCGYHLSIIRSNNQRLRGSYLFWVLRDASIASQLHRQATGITRWAIATRHVKNSSIPLPPLSEQQAITSYLDKTCAAIDKAIKAKQKQLEILDALRKSIIHKAITRGIDDSVELKDSNIDFFGTVPIDWKPTRFRYELSIRNGDFISDKLDENGLHPVVGGNGFMGMTNDFNVDEEVIAIGRVGAYCGNVHLVTKQSWISDNALIVKSMHDLKYLVYVFIALDLNSEANKTAQPVITGTKIKNIRIAIPTREEQGQIAYFLDGKLSELQHIKENIQQQISILQQYRKSLIHEYVTGKRRVNEDRAREQ